MSIRALRLVFPTLALTASPLFGANSGVAESDSPVPAEREGVSFAQGAVTPFLSYTFDGVAVTRGGINRGEGIRGLVEFGVEVDLEKLFQLSGASLHAHGLYLHGKDVTAELIGDFNYADNIVASSGLRLFQLQFETAGERWHTKVGLLSPDADFAVSDTSAIFINSAFGVLPAFSWNSGLPIWPMAGLGAWARYESGQGWFVQAGAYDGEVLDDRDHRRGTHVSVSSRQGALTVAELGSTWGESSLPGELRVGFWWHTGEFVTFDDGDQSRSNHGFHGSIEQALRSDNKLRGFARLGFAPRDDRSTVRLHVDAGLKVTGPLDGRDDDELALGWFRTEFSEGYLASRYREGSDVTGAESGIELTYSIAVSPWFTLQPDFQYIVDPHESGRNATVFIVRASVGF